MRAKGASGRRQPAAIHQPDHRRRNGHSRDCLCAAQRRRHQGGIITFIAHGAVTISDHANLNAPTKIKTRSSTEIASSPSTARQSQNLDFDSPGWQTTRTA